MSASLWYTRCPVPSATSIALTGHWFEAEFADDDVAVRSIGESPDREIRLAHYRHNHPGLLREGGLVPPAWATSTGTPVRLLALNRVKQFHGLLVRADGPITEPGQLRGARVALPKRLGQPIDFSRAVSWHGIVDCLASVGLLEDDVQFVDAVFDEPFQSDRAGGTHTSVYSARENVRLYTAEVLMLVRGEVDAIYASGPHALALAALIDARPIVALDASQDHDGERGQHVRVLTASTPLLEAHPELVIRYLAVLLRAAAWAATNLDRALEIVAAEIGVATEWAGLGLSRDVGAQLVPGDDPAAVDAVDHRLQFLRARGFLDRDLSVEAWHSPEFLTAARDLAPRVTAPSAATLVRAAS
ncbi:MAG TPA: hypothetical protein VGM78_06575 [Ilumatobacteraceae bacterium]